MFDHSDCSASAVVAAAELDSLVTARKKKTKKNTRKFSDEQIRSLEVMFESESRIEPRKKTQLARELGLQPRQVAIWFQNKRARWKSKQLERDYSILQTNYNSLASMYEALKKEKQALVAQLQKLNDLMQRPPEERQSYGQDRLGRNNIEGESDSGDATKSCESDIKPSLSMERSEHGLSVRSDGDTSTKAEYFGLEDEPNILNMVDGTMASSDGWGSLNSDDLLDQSNSSSHWWDFWS